MKNVSEVEKQDMLIHQTAAMDGVSKEKYAATVKEYTHYAIGRKISKNVPTYS